MRLLSIITLLLLITYLFADRPAVLSDEAGSHKISINEAFKILDAENHTVRALWTKEIIGEGKKQGMNFSEHWKDKDSEAGPLPALFLRETAKNLEKKPGRLSLFLGSDEPINKANLFTGMQSVSFSNIKKTGEPSFFYEKDTSLYTGMFSDTATSEACASCHNKHKDSPKTNWAVNDVMGATTWMSPKKEVDIRELFAMIKNLHQSFSEAYGLYLKKVETFNNKPVIGNQWPKDGYFLPSQEVFMREIEKQSSTNTLNQLLSQ